MSNMEKLGRLSDKIFTTNLKIKKIIKEAQYGTKNPSTPYLTCPKCSNFIELIEVIGDVNNAYCPCCDGEVTAEFNEEMININQ